MVMVAFFTVDTCTYLRVLIFEPFRLLPLALRVATCSVVAFLSAWVWNE